MPAAIHTETTCEVPFPPGKVWPILSQTDWINRALGLPPVKYEIRPLPEGGSAVIAEAKFLGAQLGWQEIPCEWMEDEFYCVHRIFERGPIAEGKMGVSLMAANEENASIFSDFPADGWCWIIRRVLAPKSDRGMMKSSTCHQFLRRNRPSQAAQKPVAESALTGVGRSARGNAGRPRSSESGLVARFAGCQLQPYPSVAVARLWNRDRWEVLRLFLHATRRVAGLQLGGLVSNCRSTREPKATLWENPPGGAL